jgi:hypothetical protein
MTPKEKAEQLVEKYRIIIKFDSTYNLKWNDVSASEESEMNHKRATKDAKIYALVAADEVIEQEQYWIADVYFNNGSCRFWQEVKKEIENL